MNKEDRNHGLELSSNLLDEIELGDGRLDRLVLRTSRLARLVSDEDAIQWLRWEQQGFPKDDSSMAWRRKTGRVFSDSEENVYMGATRMVAMVDAVREELRQTALPALSGDGVVTATNNVIKYRAQLRTVVTKNASILASVEAQIHSFVVRAFYSLRISTRQDTMFGSDAQRIDALLRGLDEDFLRRVDSAYANLENGEAEEISAAMNSVRRLIDAFADQIFPATDETRLDGQGKSIRLGQMQRLNRVKAYIDDHCQSPSRATRLKRAISDVYDRVSTGVHTEVSASDARSLFLFSYTLLGEILELSDDETVQLAQVIIEE